MGGMRATIDGRKADRARLWKLMEEACAEISDDARLMPEDGCIAWFLLYGKVCRIRRTLFGTLVLDRVPELQYDRAIAFGEALERRGFRVHMRLGFYPSEDMTQTGA